MIRYFVSALAVALLLTSPVESGIRFHGGAGSVATCLFGSSFPDGCATANQNASFTVAGTYGQSFYQLAAENGQVWSSAHPQPFNLPGIDYPVSYDRNTVFKDWIADTPPLGCSLEVPGSNVGNPFNEVVSTGSTISGTTVVFGTITKGVPEPGQTLAGAGIPIRGANVPYIVSGSGSTWTITNAGSLSLGPQTLYAGAPRWVCNSGSPDINGYDFTSKGGGQIRSSGGNITVRNSKFINGDWINFAGGYNVSSVAGTSGGSLTLYNNQFDGNHHTCTVTASYTNTTLSGTGGGTCGDTAFLHNGQLVQGGTMTNTSTTVGSVVGECALSSGAWSCAITGNSVTGGPSTITVEMADWSTPVNWSSTNCSILIEQNAFINQPASDGSLGGINCPITWAYNYAYPIGLNTLSKVHLATVVAGTGNTLNATVPALNYLFNVSGYSAAGGNGGSVCFSINGTTGKNSVFTVADIEGNTCVNNLLVPSGVVSNSVALFFLNGAGGVGTFTGKDNFTDPTGALSCIANQSNVTFTFFVDDGLGSGSYDGVPGNVITISGIGVGAVYVNGSIGSTSTVYGTLRAYGTVIPGTATPTTGTSQNGSYVFTGSAVAAGPSVAGKAWDTPVGALITGPANQVATNMLAASVAAGQSSIAISGVQWNLGFCYGHH